MHKNLISRYICKATRNLIKNNHENYRDISQQLDVSYGFFRQLMSNNRSLTVVDIYEIAKLENTPISKLFPPIKESIKGFKQFTKVTGDKSRKDFDKFMQKISDN